MQWSDLNIWENFKKMFGVVIDENNTIIVLYFLTIYITLVFTLYPFTNFNTINETLKTYKYILIGVAVVLLLGFIYIFSKLTATLDTKPYFYPLIVTLDALVVVGLLLFGIYYGVSNLSNLQILWTVINIFIVIGFIINFIYLFWKCYDKECNINIFVYWWIWACVIGLIILMSVFFISYNWYDKILVGKQGTLYLILIFSVFVILLNNGSITTGVLKGDQAVTPNSILQSMLKYLSIIGVIIFTQVLLNYSLNVESKYALYIAVFLIIVNTLPIFFNISESWLQTIILFPIFLLIIFGILFTIVGGKLFFSVLSGSFNFLRSMLGNISFLKDFFNIPFQSFIGKENIESGNNLIFQAILFIFIFGFLVYLLFASNIASKSHDSIISNALAKSLKSWWLWVSFIFVYFILLTISGINIDHIKSEYTQQISVFMIILLTIFELIVIYYTLFKSITKPLVDSSNDYMTYAKNISIILIIGVLLFSLSKYGKINTSFIIILTLLCVIFIYTKVQDTLYTQLWDHASEKNCVTSMKVTGRAIGFFVLFFSLMLAFGSSEKNNPIYIGIAILMGMVGFYIGEMISAGKNTELYKEKAYCADFKSSPKLTTTESIKTIIYISVIIFLFIAMNFFTQKIENPVNDFYKIFIIGVLFFLFVSYLVISGEGFNNIVKIFDVVFNKEYFTSNVVNRWSDFLLSITTFIVFMSGISLIITVFLNQTISNYAKDSLGSSEFIKSITKESFKEVLEMPNRGTTFFETLKNSFLKTLSLFLLLFYNIFLLFILIPIKLNKYYSEIGNFAERNFLKTALIVLFIEVAIVVLYMVLKPTYNYINSTLFDENSNRFSLIKTPVYIFPLKTEKYEELPKEQPYTFGLSFSLFIEEPGILNYFIPILSYNDNPCIMYKPSANNLVVTIPKGYANKSNQITATADKDDVIDSYTILNSHIGSVVDDKYIVYSTTDVKIQTWMNLFINYNNGVVDIFFNGKLVNSSIINQIIPENYSNTITLGFDNVEDAQIKINNLDFYNKDIGVDNILRINLKNYTE